MTLRIDPDDADAALTNPRLAARYQLLVWSGETVRPWPFPERGEALVGRAAEADIRIDSAAVSRHHARIFVEDDTVHLVDLGSQNGTRVNGERLTAKRMLVYEDIVTFGDVTAVVAPCRSTPPLRNGGLRPDVPSEDTVDLGDRKVLVADPVMAHVYTQLARLAPTDLSVLILGETGAGKELAATALRVWSKRRNGPMISINCAALPETLAESELFGFERGAFSGANGSKPGLLEAANGGTILLDEIGDLPLPVQAKLLRVIESRRMTRLGSVREQAIDVRVIAATHRDLEIGVKAGWFRADLYYRLSVAIVRIPPLRMRPRELPLLAKKFIDDACHAAGRGPLTLDDEAIARLVAHDWPGNVRELKNLIDYLVVSATGSTVTADLVMERMVQGGERAPPLEFRRSDGGVHAAHPDQTKPVRPLAQANREFERKTIEAALSEAGGNKTRAAKRLGVPLRTFMDKIKRYGL